MSGLPRHANCDHPVQTYEGAQMPCAACSTAPMLRMPVYVTRFASFQAGPQPTTKTESAEFFRSPPLHGVILWSPYGRWLSEIPLEVAAQLRARAAESELAVTRAVLEDLAAERGVPWVSLVLRQPANVLRWLKSWYAERCPHCRVDTAEAHGRDCPLAELLRALGGPEETQRQVDAAWEEALRIAARSPLPRYQVDTNPSMRVGNVTYQTSPRLVVQLFDFTPSTTTQPSPVIVSGEPPTEPDDE